MDPRPFDHLIDKHGFIYVVRSILNVSHLRTPLLYVPSRRPTPRSLNGQYYAKVTDETGFHFAKTNHPELIHRDPISDEEYVSVPLAGR